MSASQKLYEIMWKYEGGKRILALKDYLNVQWSWLFRDDVISTDLNKLNSTLLDLKLIECDDEEYYIKEVKG